MTQSNRQTVFVNFSNATTVDVQLPSESDDCELPYLVHNVGLAGEMVDTFKRLVERCSLTQCACSNDSIGTLVSSKKKKKRRSKVQKVQKVSSQISSGGLVISPRWRHEGHRAADL